MKALTTIAIVLLTMLTTALATGQEGSTPPDRMEAIDQLILLLEDDSARAGLLTQLRQLAATSEAAPPTNASTPSTSPPAENAPPSLIDALSNWSTVIADGWRTTTFGVPIDRKAQQAQTQLVSRINSGIETGNLPRFMLWAVPASLIVLTGALLLRGVGDNLTAPHQPVQKRRLAGGLLLKLVSSTAFFLLVATAVSMLVVHEVDVNFFVALSLGVLLATLLADLTISGLSALADLRGVRIIAYAQRRLFKWVLPILFLATFAQLLGLFEVSRVIGWSVADLGTFFLNLTAAAVTLLMIARNRLIIGRLIFGKRTLRLASGNVVQLATGRLSRHWHILAYAFIALSIASLFAGQQDNDVFTQASWSFGVVLAGLVGVAIFHRLYDGLLTTRRHARGAVWNAVVAGIFRVVRITSDVAIVVCTALVVLRIWGFDLWSWLAADGRQISQPLVAAAICGVITWLIWIALDAWIASALTPTDPLGRPRHRSNRAQTLLPLLRSGLMILLVVLAGIAALANIGVDVTPLLAGAGVFGLAISFGSQQLVQDVITGVFILAEDTLAIGDTVNTGDRSGVVEGISLRTLRLRDADGALHSIPFSTIKALKNSSRNYGIFRPRYSVPSSVDPEQVLEAMRETGETLKKNPRLGDLRAVRRGPAAFGDYWQACRRPSKPRKVPVLTSKLR